MVAVLANVLDFRKPKFRIIEVLTYISKIANWKKQCFKTRFLLWCQKKTSKRWKLVSTNFWDSMRTGSGSEEDNMYHVLFGWINTLQLWQISHFGWAFARTSSSCEHATNLAMGLDMCNSSITRFQSASGVMDKTLTPSPWTTQMDDPKMDYT